MDSACQLDCFLRTVIPKELPGKVVSNSKIRRLIIAGCVRINGSVCRIPTWQLNAGDSVQAFIDDEKFFFEKKPNDISFILTDSNVLYEDSDIIIVDKPAFFPTEPTVVSSRASMHQAVKDYLWKKEPARLHVPYAGVMHRLDRETSGVLLFTKTREVNAVMHEQFASHTIQKTYRALCKPTKSQILCRFSVNQPIGRISPKSAPCKMGALPVDRGGQEARTDMVIVERQSKFVLVEAMPYTGRTHQIRVHLSLAGLPIVGDTQYGGPPGLASANGRVMLHAWKLSFLHPRTGRSLTVQAPLPLEFL